ncbi:uncharacterized protein C10orf105 homolog [Echinops telfairi]|uniref:Uncharacterized protein C10orf105 homolog n=1 Tax=Echinops telfairi TaxID=9371 RepID=A0ABM0ZQ09_ECHTE|nr:uncharacterized protein C10orf105 homolog [Echinops telfairi]
MDIPSVPTSPAPNLFAFFTAQATPGTPEEEEEEAGDFLPGLIALACIFLLLVSCLLFMIVCQPAALDPRRRRCESMPHDPVSPSEPQLRLWKRLGSLRLSRHSFRRGRPAAPRRPLPGRAGDSSGDYMESTLM